MSDSESPLHARFQDARPGLALYAVEPAALPVTMVRRRFWLRERKPLPLLEEFVLRFVRTGCDTVTSIAELCGLERGLVEGSVADQISLGNLTYSAATERLKLTTVGLNTARDLEAVQPVQKQIPVAFDRITWRIAVCPPAALMTKKEAEERGMIILKAVRSARITRADLPPSELNKLLRRGHASSEIEILDVRQAKASRHRYLPVQLLVYADRKAGDIELSLVVDSESSPAHDEALSRMGAIHELGISIAAPPDRPQLVPELEEQRVFSTRPPATSEPADHAHVHKEAAAVDSEPLVRGLSVFEHSTLFNQALEETKHRLLIISPWVRNAVVETGFLGKLEQRLRKGCRVHIAHGYGEDDSGSTQGHLSDYETCNDDSPTSSRSRDSRTLMRRS